MSHLEKVTSWMMLNHAHNVTHDICLSIWFSKEFLLILAFCFLRETKNRKNSVDVYVIVTQQWHLYSEVCICVVLWCFIVTVTASIISSSKSYFRKYKRDALLLLLLLMYYIHIYHVNCEWNLINWAINRNSGLSMQQDGPNYICRTVLDLTQPCSTLLDCAQSLLVNSASLEVSEAIYILRVFTVAGVK